MQRLRSAGLVWPLLLALPALVVLLGLGTWQLQRSAWKADIMAKIEDRVHQPPVPLGDVEGRPAEDIEYARVRVQGIFRHEAEQFIWEPDPRLGPGYLVVTPLQLADGRFIMVNRGYVPERLKDPAARAEGQVQGTVEVTGLLRAPTERGMFEPERDSRTGVWYWRDLEGMARAALGTEATKSVPYLLDAELATSGAATWPRGGTTRLTLPNRHMEYALTWYGLAATLIGVLAAFAVSRLRPRAS